MSFVKFVLTLRAMIWKFEKTSQLEVEITEILCQWVFWNTPSISSIAIVIVIVFQKYQVHDVGVSSTAHGQAAGAVTHQGAQTNS